MQGRWLFFCKHVFDYIGVGAAIRTHWEILCLLYAEFRSMDFTLGMAEMNIFF